ncbi:putative GYF-like domain-containing protein [Lupinus albus]|uniref:Putative GYF-like domain-containing protein n=1 Tax=Lupinus albus TaxID=3870 RepID=A0A6A4NPB2_LUPAL|nr:putative GYF-like domain-containing protein [Lupinus albus]
MSQRSSDSRINVPSFQISKDLPGSDNPIPLSPQWLLPKPGESKPGTGTVENHVNPNSPFGNRSETVKTSRNGEDVLDVHKKKDVFRPSMLDSESGRHDRWRDEERDTKSSIRKDRWRDGGKDLGDARRVDRRTENSSTKNIGEARRGPSDRWNDSGNKDSNFDQRRESKWNTRWGPDEKEPESLHEKWNDSGKDGDLLHDKGLPHISSHGKDEEGDHYRPWRPSFSQSRGRVEPNHPPNSTPNKQASTFSYGRGRGRGENTPPAFTLGHGWAGSGGNSMNNSTYSGTVLDKVESGHGEPCAFRYNRTKLLDVYRLTDMGTNRKLLDDFVQVPNLTQDKPLEPLALSVPNFEELSVLKGIEKVEIISSVAPQVPKDGRGSTDSTHTRRMKPQDRGEDGGSYSVADDVPINRDSSFEGKTSVHPGAAWRATPFGEHSSPLLYDSRDVPSDVRSRKVDKSSNQPKEPHNQQETNLAYLSDSKDVSKWQASDDPNVKRKLSGIFDSELETRKVPQTAPEELSLFYKDPNGQIQGPFKGIDIIGWFEAGYFGIDLTVRLENSEADSPWLSLGDVMPHLRAKARPPPGFSAPKPTDSVDVPGRPNSSTFGNTLHSLSEADMLRSGSRHMHSPATESENRFLESLMSGNKGCPPLDGLTFPEGLQGFVGNNSGSLGAAGVDSGNNLLLLAKRMALERQRSLPNPYPFWPGRDAAVLPPKSDIVPDASLHSKLLSSVSDNSRLPQSQTSEMLSIIQGLSDRTSAGLNNGVAGWPNYPLQGGLDSLQNKVELHHDQNLPQVPFEIQQQRLHAQNQLALSNLLSQTMDNPHNMLAAEKPLSSGLQDPQVLNLLQQYALQFHSQAAATTSQMPLLDKLLLLKQQQKQEEQQQLLRQQQQLLSQLLQDQQSNQPFGDSLYGQLQGSGIPIGNLHVDPSLLRPPQEIFPMNSKTPIPTVHDDLSSKYLNLTPKVSQDTNYNVRSEGSVHLPHQLFENTSQKNWGSTLPEQIDEKNPKESFQASTLVERSQLHDKNRSEEEPHIVQKPLSVSDFTSMSVVEVPANTFRYDGTVVTATSQPDENSDHLQHVVPIAISSASSRGIELPPVSYLGKDVKIKSDVVLEEHQTGRDDFIVEPSVEDARNVGASEPKKSSEKKSKKQKSSKTQLSDQANGLLKIVALQQSEAEMPNFSDVKLGEANKDETNLQQRSKGNQTRVPVKETVDHQEAATLPVSVSESILEKVVASEFTKSIGSVPKLNTDSPAGRAWKPAPGVKAKSLIEIQLEEQKKAVTEMLVSEVATSVSSMNLTSPWTGVVANPESGKISSENHRGGNMEYLIKPESSENLKSKKSPLHDLLAEEVLKKFNERESDIADDTSSQNIGVVSESLDDSNFIEAKESKRSRKKLGKSKGSGTKASVPVASNEMAIASSPVEKGKMSRLLQQEKEVLPAIPAGPSLGDFFLWKGERESPSPSPSPAWSTVSGRVLKPTSLRDILKEQEKKASSLVPASPIPTPQKLQPTQANWSTGSSRSISASSPSKAASPIQSNFHASQLKYKGDDDLFWGPIEQSKPETKLSDFPQLAGQGSRKSKNVPLKGNSPGLLSRQKSVSGKPTAQSLSSSPASSQSILKSKKDVMTKHSEAMGFRDWCENECVRLIGTKDTSFLEFCLKQSKSEAEMLLTENLGSYDPDHKFIDKFLNYMEMLPSDVLEIAFKNRSDQKVSGLGVGPMLSANAASAAATDMEDVDHTEGSSKGGGGKKKGKKGKKVSPSVLGFNVVSNRIMMGEIQTIED